MTRSLYIVRYYFYSYFVCGLLLNIEQTGELIEEGLTHLLVEVNKLTGSLLEEGINKRLNKYSLITVDYWGNKMKTYLEEIAKLNAFYISH